MASLLIRTPDGRERTVPLIRPITQLGRSSGCDVPLEESHLGSGALVLTVVGGRHQVSGLGAAFTVNERKRDTHVLADRDVIRVGDTTLTYSTRSVTAEVVSVPRAAPAAQTSDPDSHTREIPGVVAREQVLLESLVRVSRQLLESYAIEPMARALVDEAIRVTRADKGFLFLSAGGQLETQVARTAEGEDLADASLHASDSVVQRVMETHKPLIVAEAAEHPDFKQSESVVNLKLRSVMCVPLTQKGRAIGAIYVGNDRLANRFEQKSLDMLAIFAAQASLLLQNALLVNELQLDNSRLQQQLESGRFGEIIGSCESMQAVFRRIEKIAATDIGVLITGETGTGKELVARELHRRSPRAKEAFVTINCGAIPENLLESELFGHVRGAFTGAVTTRGGKFQAAHKGTLFLDEIGEMPLQLQVKLLRALQEKVVYKVGDTRGEAVDIRVVAATNRVLEQEVKKGTFREDLFYRLNVVTLRLPPLRERLSDIPMLGRYFLERYAREFGATAREFSKQALEVMTKYGWPGNIRELENRLKKAVVLTSGTHLTPEDLDLRAEQLEPLKPLAQAIEDFRVEYIDRALARNRHNRTKAARDLQVDPRTIFRHLEAKRAAEGAPPPSEEDDGEGEV